MIPAPKIAAHAVLIVCPSSQPLITLSSWLEGPPCSATVLHSGDCRQAFEILAASRTSVVICEATLPDGEWKDL